MYVHYVTDKSVRSLRTRLVALKGEQATYSLPTCVQLWGMELKQLCPLCLCMHVRNLMGINSWWSCEIMWWSCGIMWWSCEIMWWLCGIMWWLCGIMWWSCEHHVMVMWDHVMVMWDHVMHLSSLSLYKLTTSFSSSPSFLFSFLRLLLPSLSLLPSLPSVPRCITRSNYSGWLCCRHFQSSKSWIHSKIPDCIPYHFALQSNLHADWRQSPNHALIITLSSPVSLLLPLSLPPLLPLSLLPFSLPPSPPLSTIQEGCQNYHHILLYPGGSRTFTAMGQQYNLTDTVLVCGSNAYSPECHFREVSSYSMWYNSKWYM